MTYLVVNLGYSLGLKNIPILDIILLVSGFILRIFYGALIVNSSASSWVYLTVLSASFYLSLGKRRNEIRKAKGNTRKVLSFYNYEFLDKFMYACLTLTIAFYALWSADTRIMLRYGTNKLIWTVPVVMIIMMKYSYDIEMGSYDDPVEVLTKDKWLILLSFFYIVILLGLIYL